MINAGVQPVQNLGVLNEIGSRFGAEHKIPWGKWVIERGFDQFEAVVGETMGKYCVGDDITLADVFLAPQMANATRFGCDMSKYPNITKITDTYKDIPEFVAAEPRNQSDYVE